MTATGRGLEPLRASRAALVLGRGHPLSRMVTLVRALALLMTAGSAAAAVGALGVAERRAWGVGLLCIALVAVLVLAMVCALARQLRREQVLWLIADGGAWLPVVEISREAQRLAAPRRRILLAERLERALDEAMRWDHLPVASRPPPGVRLLCASAAEIRVIAGQLRSGMPGLPGVALLELVVAGGYGSVLYAGDHDLRCEQLRRIQHLIRPAASAEQWGAWG